MYELALNILFYIVSTFLHNMVPYVGNTYLGLKFKLKRYCLLFLLGFNLLISFGVGLPFKEKVPKSLYFWNSAYT